MRRPDRQHHRADALTHKFGLLLKRHGLRHIRFHDLRHSCASLLVANGVPIKMVQFYMGHSNYSTTADIYAHLSPEALDASAACMESLLVPKTADSTGEEVVQSRECKKAPECRNTQVRLADRVGFEPTVPLRVHLISSQGRYNHFDTCPYLLRSHEPRGYYDTTLRRLQAFFLLTFLHRAHML